MIPYQRFVVVLTAHVLCAVGVADDTSSVLLEKPIIGTRVIIKNNQPRYGIDSFLGIDIYRESKFESDYHEQWYLSCQHPGWENVRNRETDCTLDRLIMSQRLKFLMGLNVFSTRYTSKDGSLKIVHSNWQAGELNFDLISSQREKIEVFLKMIYHDYRIILLNSFKAISIDYNAVEEKYITTEYKIPEYTYVLNIPIEMKGMKSEERKAYDDFIKSLSEHDRLLFETESKDDTLFLLPDENYMKKKVKERLTPTEYKNMDAKDFENLTPDGEEKFLSILLSIMTEALEKGLAKSRLSADGKAKVRNYFGREDEKRWKSFMERGK